MSVSRPEPTEPAASSPHATGGPPADETLGSESGRHSGRARDPLGQSRTLGSIACDLRARGDPHGRTRRGTHDLVLLGGDPPRRPRPATR